MMHVLVDSDIICYRIACSTEEENEKIAISRCAYFIESMLWEDLENVETYQCYLTGKENFRYDIAKTAPYKGNRTAPKPKHLQTLRDYLVSAWDAKISIGQEADDEIAIEHTARNHESIIASIDKDFLQLYGSHWNFVKKEMTVVNEAEALLNFYLQVTELITSLVSRASALLRLNKGSQVVKVQQTCILLVSKRTMVQKTESLKTVDCSTCDGQQMKCGNPQDDCTSK